jgi:hypothetical protein
MNSLSTKTIEFKGIERIFFEIGCEVARTLMEQYLLKADKILERTRDKAKLRHKGSRTTTIKTLMGEVVMKRTLYKRVNEAGATEHIFLLDEALGLDTIGNISPNLVEKILGQSCEMSYREVSEAITGMTNQSISHQGVWNVVQAVGERQAEEERRLVKAYENQQLSGKREVPVLFEEADGLWLSMQGESRKGSLKGKREMKIRVVYEGWEQRYPCSKEYKTIGKTSFAGYMKAKEFKFLRDAIVAEKYNTDEIRYRVLNGDGAAWIANDDNPEGHLFQLDPYHLSKSVVRNVYDKSSRRHIKRWLKEGQFEKVFSKLEELKHECGGLEEEVKNLTTLEMYIRNNMGGIVSYRKREGIKIPLPPEGVEYRNLGTMERNVNIYAKRMKGGKSWSLQGASNLSKIIALKMGKDFNDKIASLVSGKLSEKLTERFEEAIRATKASVREAVRKSVYPMHRGEIPFSKSKVTNGRKAIRRLFNLQPFSEMAYR